MSKASHRRQVVNYIFITNYRQFSYSCMYNLLTVEITSSHLRVCPISLPVLPKSLRSLLGTGTTLLSDAHSLAVTRESFSGFGKVPLSTFLYQQTFYKLGFLQALFPQIAEQTGKAGNAGSLNSFLQPPPATATTFFQV